MKALLLQQGKVASQAADGVTSSADELLRQLAEAAAVLQVDGAGGHSFALLALLTPAVMAVIAAAAPGKEYDGYTDRLHPDDVATLGHEYSAEAAAEYFRRRPLAVAHRAAQVSAEVRPPAPCARRWIWSSSSVRISSLHCTPSPIPNVYNPGCNPV